MAQNKSRGKARNDTTLFTREVFYLAVGCGLLFAAQWLKDRLFTDEPSDKI